MVIKIRMIHRLKGRENLKSISIMFRPRRKAQN
ncbi:hypothetical protein GcC1_163019 [Golovinomyces cichoracearum]|uniref:Uncharacterized protein n=1 Tax=Golovinomyces cichoracearum TaxID=62708 RepID=A0A420HTG1_9PEZI|nr:hypothetical protein GcC1_163019 [Golovinomyces cichoracearum]